MIQNCYVLFAAALLGIVASRTLANDCDAAYLHNISLAHQSITEDLFNGYEIHYEPLKKDGNAHTAYKIRIRNPKNGHVREAVLKPRSWGDEDGWSRTPMEYVGYMLNRKLSMDYVPPVVYVRNFKLGDNVIGEGAIIFWAEGGKLLYDTPDHEWGVASSAGVVSDNRVLNVLMQNPDGHYKNLLLAKHWVDGKMRPVFVDFGASLRPGTVVTMTHYPAFRNSSIVTQVRHTTLDQLRKLEFQDLKREFSAFMSEGEIWALLARRDGIVQYFDRLIQERGWNNVVIEN